MNGRELQCVEVEKELGVFVDMDLKFEQHINETVKKIDNSRHDHATHLISKQTGTTFYILSETSLRIW